MSYSLLFGLAIKLSISCNGATSGVHCSSAHLPLWGGSTVPRGHPLPYPSRKGQPGSEPQEPLLLATVQAAIRQLCLPMLPARGAGERPASESAGARVGAASWKGSLSEGQERRWQGGRGTISRKTVRLEPVQAASEHQKSLRLRKLLTRYSLTCHSRYSVDF